jgi:hypothetical protein
VHATTSQADPGEEQELGDQDPDFRKLDALQSLRCLFVTGDSSTTAAGGRRGATHELVDPLGRHQLSSGSLMARLSAGSTLPLSCLRVCSNLLLRREISPFGSSHRPRQASCARFSPCLEAAGSPAIKRRARPPVSWNTVDPLNGYGECCCSPASRRLRMEGASSKERSLPRTPGRRDGGREEHDRGTVKPCLGPTPSSRREDDR